MREPRISICMPNYNYGRFIGKALESILSQSFGDFEVIVADDASTDESVNIIQEYAKRDRRIRLFLYPTNAGVIENSYRCTRQARGELITTLQSDDFYATHDFLSMADRAFRAEQGLVMCHTAFLSVAEDGTPIRMHRMTESECCLDGRDALKRLLLLGGFWPSTAVIDRQVFWEVGGFRRDVGLGQDLLLAYLLCLKGRIWYSPIVGVGAREHSNSVTRSLGDRLESEIVKILDHFSEYVGDDPEVLAVIEEAKRGCQSPFRHNCSREYLTKRMTTLISEWVKNHRSVVIYGAGEHTRQLLEWVDFTGVNLLGLCDTDPRLHQTERHGYLIYAPDDLPAVKPDVILVSSASYQGAIMEHLATLPLSASEIIPVHIQAAG